MEKVENFIWPFLGGNFDASLFAFYDFLIMECDVKLPAETLKSFEAWKATSSLSLIYPYEGFCVVSKKPQEINLKGGVLHKDGGASVSYADGFNCYHLNGVAVPQSIAEIPGEQLDCKLLLTLDNAEVRRELVRKVGMERIIDKLGGEVIDKEVERKYELIRFKALKVNGDYPVYLKMVNPSIGCYHVEGVPSNVRTVMEAIHFRKPEVLKKIPIDNINGRDYYQQGDVIVWPENAKSMKFWPAMIT